MTSSIEPESRPAVVSGTFPPVSPLGGGSRHLRADKQLSGERQSDLEQPQWPSDPAPVDLGQNDPAPNEAPLAGDAAPADCDPTASDPALPPLQRRKPGTTNLPPQLLHPAGNQDPGGFSDEAPNPALAGMFVQARRTQAAGSDATDA
jgi:hypothetical protein